MATRHYLKLEGRLQMAEVSRDENRVAELTPMLERATEEQAKVRRQIDQHEAQERAGAAATA